MDPPRHRARARGGAEDPRCALGQPQQQMAPIMCDRDVQQEVAGQAGGEAGWSGAGQAAGLSGVIPPKVWGMVEILLRRQPPESITPQISFVWSLRRPRVASCKKLPIVSEFQTQSTQDQQPLRTLNLFLRQRGLQCGPAAMDDLKDALKVSQVFGDSFKVA